MSESTELASGRITRAHSLRVVLQEQADNPPVVLIEWPDQPTITTLHQLQAVAVRHRTFWPVRPSGWPRSEGNGNCEPPCGCTGQCRATHRRESPQGNPGAGIMTNRQREKHL